MKRPSKVILLCYWPETEKVIWLCHIWHWALGKPKSLRSPDSAMWPGTEKVTWLCHMAWDSMPMAWDRKCHLALSWDRKCHLALSWLMGQKRLSGSVIHGMGQKRSLGSVIWLQSWHRTEKVLWLYHIYHMSIRPGTEKVIWPGPFHSMERSWSDSAVDMGQKRLSSDCHMTWDRKGHLTLSWDRKGHLTLPVRVC